MHCLGKVGLVQPPDELPMVDLLLLSGQAEWEHDRSIPMTEQGREVKKL